MEKTSVSLVILGGGTAGWLSALFVKHYYPSIDITVVEDPKKPPIIAGESGGFALSQVYNRIGILFNDWAKTVGATPKLGGQFVGWNGKGSEFWHSLITPHYYAEWDKRFSSIEERYYFLRMLIGMDINIADIVPTGQLLKNNKVPFDDYGAIVDRIFPMWHFDSRANAAYLKQQGLERGIKLVENTYVGCIKNQSGNIKKIIFEDNADLEAEWFFDCSGFARLLLEKEMKAEVIDQSAYFPACAVLPWWDKPVYSTATLATTMNAGWTWQIGLKERTGQGYLYDPNYLTKDQALDEIRNKFGQHVEPVASLQFTPSIMKQSQVKNVIGIGLSTGFMEPLEANGTGIIVDQLLALLDNWSPVEYNALNEKHFNENVLEKYLGIRDFLSLHYRGKGNESNFWKEQADPNRVPETLKEKLSEFERFYATGKMDFAKYLNGFSIESWLTVIQGIGIIDSKAISVGDKHHFIDNYYKETVKPFDHIYRRCIKIEKWIDKTSNIA
jgi:hypothetical protein